MTPYLHDLAGLFDKIECRSAGSVVTVEEGLAAAKAMLQVHTRVLRKKLILVGNGGSAAVASHVSVDAIRHAGMFAMVLTDGPLLTCMSNDFGYANVYKRPLEVVGEGGDVLIAISSSGRSENIIEAAVAAVTRGLRIITLTGFDPDNGLRDFGELNFWTPSRSYGHVEISHLVILHALIDSMGVS